MKTIGIISSVMATLAIGVVTGLPLAFALLLVAAAVAETFGAGVLIGSVVNPFRKPLTIASARGRVMLARPISRAARVAA